ncbi:MAG: DUF2273 domain-containing protein [Clostridia bacterium]|nr:DUF2273 domain-containing protein [Clostridia bacterium]
MPGFGSNHWNIPEDRAGSIIGAAAGAVFGLLVIVAGFWRALAFLFFVALGFMIGRYIDVNDDVKDDLARRFGRPRD